MEDFLKRENSASRTSKPRISPIMSALKEQSSARALDRALSFYPETGSSIISKELKDDVAKKVTTYFVKDPPATTLAAIVQVAKSNSSVSGAILEIATGLIKTCFYFKVFDINQIAYVLATVDHESYFGKKMVEDDSYLLHLYEPVFSDQNCIDTQQPIIKDDDECKSLIALSRTLIKGILSIYRGYVDDLREIDDIEMLLDLLMTQATTGLQEFVDEYLSKYLADLDAHRWQDICDWFVENDRPLRHFSQNDKDLKTIIPKLIKLPVTGTDPNPDPLLIMFFELQLKLLLIDWLLTRIYQSTDLGNDTKGDGETFKGKGLVQLTGRGHYTTITNLFQSESRYYQALQNLGVTDTPDLVSNPDLATNPNIAIVVTVGGMAEGLFTGRKLSSYSSGSRYNFFDARGIVNGDKTSSYNGSKIETVGEHIETIARKYVTALQTEDPLSSGLAPS